MIPNTQAIEGVLDIFWMNANDRPASPKFRLIFARMAGGDSGAQQTRLIVGFEALEAYLRELNFSLPNAKSWVDKIKLGETVSIPNVILTEKQAEPFNRP